MSEPRSTALVPAERLPVVARAPGRRTSWVVTAVLALLLLLVGIAGLVRAVGADPDRCLVDGEASSGWAVRFAGVRAGATTVAQLRTGAEPNPWEAAWLV